jgi:molybdate transport system substrate-binding protein
MTKVYKRVITIWCLFLLIGCTREERGLMIFAGAASQRPLTEAASIFEEKEGVEVEIIFGGSGALLSQFTLSKMGDIYIPGSDDYMDKAEKKGVVFGKTRKSVAFLLPSLIVAKGQPKGNKAGARFGKR